MGYRIGKEFEVAGFKLENNALVRRSKYVTFRIFHVEVADEVLFIAQATMKQDGARSQVAMETLGKAIDAMLELIDRIEYIEGDLNGIDLGR